MAGPGPRRLSGVTYHEAGDEYFASRALRRHAGVWSLWALGVAAVISGDFFGWNFGLAAGGFAGLAAATLLIIVCIYRFLPGFFSRVAILLGLVLGTLVAIPFGATNFSRLGDAALFQLTPFEFGTPTFFVGAIISMFIVMLVIMTETTADILAIGEVVDKPLTRRDVTGGLQADMLSTSVAVVPLPVLGGAGLVLFGTVAASGIRTLSRVEYEGNANLVVVAIALGMGVIPIAVPDFYEHFPTWFQVIFESGISAAAIAAIALNLLFNYRRGHLEEAPIFAEAPRSARPSKATSRAS